MVPRAVEQVVVQFEAQTAVSAMAGERAQKAAGLGHVAPALAAAASPERALGPDVDARQPGCVGHDWKAAKEQQIELTEGDKADPFEAHEEARH